MPRYALPATLLAAAALVLSGCSAAPQEDSTPESMTVWIMKGTNPDTQSYYDRVGAAFEEETGVPVVFEEVQWADAHDRFVTAIAGGTTPDVAETGTTWTAEFAASGALAPIDEMVAAAGLEGDLVQGLVDSGTYEGELYGMPWYAGVRAVLYRADVFDDLGLQEPTTWAELVDAAEVIAAERPELIPFPVPGDAEQLVYPFVWGAGGQVATQTDGAWVSGLDSEQAQDGIGFLTSLALEHDFSTAGATTWKETDLLDAFASGDVAMAIMGSWTPSAILEKNPDLEGKIGAMPIPGRDGGIAPAVLGGSHLSIFDTAQDRDLAFELVRMMTTGDFATEWVEGTGYFPGEQTLMESAVASGDPLVTPFAVQMVEGGAALPVTPAFAAVQAKKSVPTMMQSILSGKSTVSQASQAAASEMTELLNGE